MRPASDRCRLLDTEGDSPDFPAEGSTPREVLRAAVADRDRAVFDILGDGDLVDFGEGRAYTTWALAGPRAYPIADDSGHGDVPATVTARLADPVAFYRDTNLEIVRIQLDPGVPEHAALLRAAAGGRDVHPACRVSYGEPPAGWEDLWPEQPGLLPPGEDLEDPAYQVLTPRCPELEGWEEEPQVWYPLNALTPGEYLEGHPRLERDPGTDRLRGLRRQAFEHFRAWLGAPGTVGHEVGVFEPTDPRNPSRGGLSRIGTIERVEDGAVHVRTRRPNAEEFRLALSPARGEFGGTLGYYSDGGKFLCVPKHCRA